MTNDAPTDGWQRPAPEITSVTKPFWDAARERRLILQYCTEANRFQHYPRPVSIYTGQKTLEWREVGGNGTIYALTETHRGPPAFRGREPYLIATIELDEQVRMMSNLVNAAARDIRIGARVRLAWAPMADGLNFPVFALE
jgi:uncharacterized OB-fold protein